MLAFILALSASGTGLEFDSTHSKLGFAMFLIGSLLCVGGMVTSAIKFKMPYAWNTRRKILLSKGHGYFAYVVMLFGQVVIASGLINFFSFEGEDKKGYVLLSLSWAFFIIVLLVGELWYQMMMQRDIKYTKVD